MPESVKKRRRIPSRRQIAEEARRAAESILREHRGDHLAAIADLTDQTYRLREKLRMARGGALKEGEVKLSGDDVKRWEAVRALNLTPEEITGLSTKVKDLETKLREREETDLLVGVAETTQFPRDILVDLAKARGLKFETKTEKVKSTDKDGKEVIETRQVVMVTEPGEGKAPIEFSEYIESKASKYKGLLGTQEDKDDNKGGEKDTTTRRRTFNTSQSTSGDDKGLKGSIDEAVEKNRAAALAPNPLRPAKAS